MNSIWTSASLAEALSAQIPKGIIGQKLQFNSRDVSEGDVFIALKGDNGDGHQYVADALKRGAACAIVSQAGDDQRLILVPDTFEALQKLALYKRAKSKAKFIAITGSLGKTSTKEAIATIVQHYGKSIATRGNFNNHIGVPLDLASMPDDLDYAVIEMGMDHPGEISHLSKMVRPDIAIITNVAQAHLVFFGSEEGVADAKCEIFDGMDEGIVLLNHDNVHFKYCKDKAVNLKVLSFGNSKGVDYRISDYTFDGKLAHMNFILNGNSYKAETTLVGRHMAINLVAAIGVSDILGFEVKESIKTIKDLIPKRGRGEQIKLILNGKNCILVHDCYNAGPLSVKAALEHLKEIRHPHKIAILADMKWLGEDEIAYHLDLEECIKDAGLVKLYTVGSLMYHLHDKLKSDMETRHFDDASSLRQEIMHLIDQDSLILMKGSNNMGLLSLADYFIKEGSAN